MRQLKVDLADLTFAFENASYEAEQYLDLETGQVILVTGEMRRYLEEIDEEMSGEGETAQPTFADLLQQSDIPEWMKEMVQEADQVEAGYGTRYLAVPHTESRDGYADMADFIDTVQDQRLQDLLARAIHGRGPFRRFKDVLAQAPGERERWFAFKEGKLRQRVCEWLASEGIELIEDTDDRAGEPENAPSEPPPRARLLAEVLAFVQAARQLPGVTRIALIGSLTTDKSDPKDADLLVTVADDADLTPLATLGRRLQGHAQGFNRGGEVFLTDPQCRYIGRTCAWKRCEPGIRQSCDALHCGRRHYLHDDLKSLRLPESLVTAPPLELWPRVVARVPIPEDVQQGLIAALEKESKQSNQSDNETRASG
jgi:hypothetical protein